MTTAHTPTSTSTPTPTSFERCVRREHRAHAACLRVCWAVAPSALGGTDGGGRDGGGRVPATLELELREGEPARVTLNGEVFQPATSWASAWDGALAIRRVGAGPGRGLVVARALPLAVAVLHAGGAGRPLHVACDLPKVLGLAGGRYELVGCGLSG